MARYGIPEPVAGPCRVTENSSVRRWLLDGRKPSPSQAKLLCSATFTFTFFIAVHPHPGAPTCTARSRVVSSTLSCERAAGTFRSARPAPKRSLQLPDRRLARTAYRIQRQACPSLTSVAFDFEPAVSAIQTLVDRWGWLSGSTEAFHLLRPCQAVGGARLAHGFRSAFPSMFGVDARAPHPVAPYPLSCWSAHGPRLKRRLRRRAIPLGLGHVNHCLTLRVGAVCNLLFNHDKPSCHHCPFSSREPICRQSAAAARRVS